MTTTLYDVSQRCQIELTGSDRAKFLHNFCTNDIVRLLPGHGTEAFFCNVKGRVVGHGFVFAQGDSLWIDGVAGQEEKLLAHLDRYLIREDVILTGHSHDRGEIYVSGPSAWECLSQAVSLKNTALHDTAEPPLLTATHAGEQTVVRRVDLFGEPGYLVSLLKPEQETLTQQLQALGVPLGTPEEWESRRIAAGFPAYGIDVTEDHLAQEVARTTQAISFNKGCYLGQEPIARLDALGHTNRELRRLTVSAGPLLDPGSELHAFPQGPSVGTLTSNAVGLDGQTIVALGYVRTRHATAGTTLFVGPEDRTAVVL